MVLGTSLDDGCYQKQLGSLEIPDGSAFYFDIFVKKVAVPPTRFLSKRCEEMNWEMFLSGDDGRSSG